MRARQEYEPGGLYIVKGTRNMLLPGAFSWSNRQIHFVCDWKTSPRQSLRLHQPEDAVCARTACCGIVLLAIISPNGLMNAR